MEKSFKTKFIESNKKFWSKYKETDSSELLLVETNNNPVINHSNAVVAKIVAKAKNLRIAWLEFEFTNRNLMISYSFNSIFVKFQEFTLITKIYLFLQAIYYYLFYILIINRIHSFKYKDINYGDFIYDGYLSMFSMAKLHRFDPRLIATFNSLLINDRKARLLLKNSQIKAVLVSHYIGLKTGPLVRVALQKKIPAYWKGGGEDVIDFAVFKRLDQVHNFPKKPSKRIIDYLVNNKKIIEMEFNEFISQVDNPNYFGAFSIAYDNKLSSKIDKETFLKKMKLKDMPLMFVMLHAFNDHPHSHFGKMLFNDYYDWFIQTFHFAQKDKSKNWIFKEHPANKFYQTKDLDLSKLMEQLPDHIRYISYKSEVKASTVLNVANAIITCAGTAGVEMPALRGIPSIIAGNTFYDGLGFTIKPKTKKEYFLTLKNYIPTRLTDHQQLIAKSCYLYIQKYSIIQFSAGVGPIDYLKSKKQYKSFKKYYFCILQNYKKDRNKIYQQFLEYVKEIRKPDFYILTRLPGKITN